MTATSTLTCDGCGEEIDRTADGYYELNTQLVDLRDPPLLQPAWESTHYHLDHLPKAMVALAPAAERVPEARAPS